jgi:hypothetical protein
MRQNNSLQALIFAVILAAGVTAAFGLHSVSIVSVTILWILSRCFSLILPIIPEASCRSSQGLCCHPFHLNPVTGSLTEWKVSSPPEAGRDVDQIVIDGWGGNTAAITEDGSQ